MKWKIVLKYAGTDFRHSRIVETEGDTSEDLMEYIHVEIDERMILIDWEVYEGKDD